MEQLASQPARPGEATPWRRLAVCCRDPDYQASATPGDPVNVATGQGFVLAIVRGREGHLFRVRVILSIRMEYWVALPGDRAPWAKPEQMCFVREAPPCEVAEAGRPQRPGLVSCAGRVEGRYAADGPVPVQITFRSGKVTVSMMGDQQTQPPVGELRKKGR